MPLDVCLRLQTDILGLASGDVWMTAIIRDNFEQFGGYISVDTTKSGVNKWL